MRSAAIAIVIAGVLLPQASKPAVSAVHLDGGGSAFLIKSTNATGKVLPVTPDGVCRMRLDGAPEDPARGGSGGAHQVAAGETWLETVRLVTWPRDPTGRRPANPQRDRVQAYREVQVSIKPGTHTVEFNCGGEWSDKFTFEWTGVARPLA